MADKAWSTDEESYNFESLEEAIEALDDPQPGDIVYEGDVVQRAASHYLPKIEWLFEQMEEKAYDEAGEHSEDWPGSGMTDEGCKALKDGLKALVDQHVRVHFYTVANVQRIELTAEMIAATRGAPECSTCHGVGTIDERLGGYSFSNPAAKCPDCGGTGEGTSGVKGKME